MLHHSWVHRAMCPEAASATTGQSSPKPSNNQRQGVPNCSRLRQVLSLSLDKSGGAYISTMEARKYPFTAVQWHPEKNP